MSLQMAMREGIDMGNTDGKTSTSCNEDKSSLQQRKKYKNGSEAVKTTNRNHNNGTI